MREPGHSIIKLSLVAPSRHYKAPIVSLPIRVSIVNQHESDPSDPKEEAPEDEISINTREIFVKIYNEYVDRLLDFALAFIDNREEVRDLVADVFVRLWEMRDRFDNIRSVKSFLYISVRNACLNYLRVAKITAARQKALLNELEHTDIVEGPTDLETAYRNRLFKEIDNLPERCKLVFNLAFFTGLSNDEIANRLSLSKLTIRNQKVKAIRLLRLAVFAKTVLLFISIRLLFCLFN